MTSAREISVPRSGLAAGSLSPPLWQVAAGLTLLAFALRSCTFFYSVQNWDESLYLLMGRSLLDGAPLYASIWEHKPPGIAVLFAFAQLIFGRTVLSLRIFGCLAVAASSVLLFSITRSLRDSTTGIVAGVLYVVFSLTYGLPTNIEISIAPFVILAFWVALAHEPERLLADPKLALGLGLAAGCALQVSYIAVFDLSALGIFLLSYLWKDGRHHGRLLRFVALAAVGPLALFVAAALWFAAIGHFGDYFDANFASNVNYVGDSVDYRRLAWMVTRRVREAFPLWLSLGLAALYIPFFPSLGTGARRGLAAGLLWAAFALPGICVTGRLFAHYFLELLPAQCLVCALVLCSTIDAASSLPSRARTVILLLLVLLGPALRVVERPLTLTASTVYHRYVRGTAHWGDEPAAVADYLRTRIAANDYLYVADYQPIVYYLVPARIPTRFPFPLHLTDEWWKRLTRVDPADEMRSIFAKQPLYVIKAKEADTSFYQQLHGELNRGYRLEQTIGSVEIYRRAVDLPASP
jgi:hypothetical protein